MIIGVPREIKSNEFRIAMLPVGVKLLTQDAHKVLVEAGAGLGSGYSDHDFQAAGAELLDDADDIYDRADMIVKVKEPQRQELDLLRAGQIIFTYFHFAASRELTEACLQSGITAVAYETLADGQGRLPLLTPMSEVAGKMSIQEGAKYLERPMMGRGILLGGVAGVEPGQVLILGGGIVGSNAATVAAGLGARVVIMDINLDRLRYLDEVMPANVTTIYSDPFAIAAQLPHADLVIGAVLIPGAKAPVLLPRRHLATMKPGAVIVDVSIDQGGCFETSRPTTHGEPTYTIDGVVHYCVANMPGAVGRTSSQALCNATLPYVRELAALGADRFAAVDAGHRAAVNLRSGRLTNPGVISAFTDLPRE